MPRKSQNIRLYNKAVDEIRELLKDWLNVGVDIFLKLRAIDLDGTWKLGGEPTFVAFLHKEFPNAIGIERYRNVIQAIDIHGEEMIRAVGVHACHALTAHPVQEDTERRALLQESIREYSRERGVAPDTNKIIDLRNGIFTECVKPAKETRFVTERAQMKAKLRELAQTLKERDRQVAELEAECERLRKQLAESGRKTGGARKPRRKVARSEAS